MKIIRINAMWCPGCLVSKGIWKEIEKEYPNYEYIDYDYDLDNDIVEKYSVGDVVPCVIVLDDNIEIKRIVGEKSKKEILRELEEV